MGNVRWSAVAGAAVGGAALVWIRRRRTHPAWLGSVRRAIPREVRPLAMAFAGGVARGLAKRLD